MALPTAAARSLACHSCRQWMLRSFIASIGGSAIHAGPSPQQRPFSSPSIRMNEARERIQKEEREERDTNGSDHLEARSENQVEQASPPLDTPEQPPSQDAHVPWYLQVDSPIPEQDNVLSARQKIPDLPDHPPPILQPLLKRISVELGMDDLSLLDLRGLDPPPALGANLLMIVGTARSDKHLHFSADKLCRWLRSEHHLSPFADGLLGRQELKVKMRRRAKRSRLLSAVGAKTTADTELDEGIRTGWICVNLGRVEGGELPKTEEEVARQKTVVGFGTQNSGARIVVQLMTEEKRGEIDLEKLWTAVMKKSRSEKEALQENEAAESRPSVDLDTHESADHSTGVQQRHTQSLYGDSQTGFGQQQARAYHTSARRLLATQKDPLTADGPEAPAVLPGGVGPSPEPAQSLSTLTSMLDTLRSMPQSTALQTLGEDFMAPSTEPGEIYLDSESPGSAEFVETFYSAMPTFPVEAHRHAHVQLLSLAYRFGHPNVDDKSLVLALEGMTVAGMVPKEESYTTALGALLGKVERNSASFESQMETVFDMLEEMEHYGYDALRPEILEALHRALVGPPSTTEPITLQSLVPALGMTRLKRHVANGDAQKFWKTWNSFPRRLMPRRGELYAVLFDALADENSGMDFHQTRHQVNHWMSTMEHEDPPVTVEGGAVELAMSLFKAMKYVDPLAEIMEWNEMRGRCEKVLRAALQ